MRGAITRHRCRILHGLPASCGSIQAAGRHVRPVSHALRGDGRVLESTHDLTTVRAPACYAARVATVDTPAVRALQRAGVRFELLQYDYDASADAIGLHAAHA